MHSVKVNVVVNLMLIGFDYYNEDNACLQDGILKQLRKRKMQRFFRRQGDMVQETDDSHVEYVVQYRFIQLSPTVQIYFRHLMEQAYRDVDMNLMSVKLINPYELVQAVDDLFQYVRDYSDEPVPSETEPLILLLNSHLDGKGPFGFSTEFTYRELQKMIDEIFRKDSEFAISDFIFPLTEPLPLEDPSPLPPPAEPSLSLPLHLDWRLPSHRWSLARDQSLSALAPVAQRHTRRALTLLRDTYPPAERRRLLVRMKQLLNRDPADILVDAAEGAAVADFAFPRNLLVADVTAGPFVWGAVHKPANGRTDQSLFPAGMNCSAPRDANQAMENLAGFVAACDGGMKRSVKWEDSRGFAELVKRSDECPAGKSVESRYSVEELRAVAKIVGVLGHFVDHVLLPPFFLPAGVGGKPRNLPEPSRDQPPALWLRNSLADALWSKPRGRRRVHFQVSVVAGEDAFPADDGFFDYSVFRGEVERLRRPGEEFFFSFQALRLEAEPRLQSVLLRAITAGIVPHLSSRKSVFPVQQRFLNATILAEALRSDGSPAGREVQIYILSLSGTEKSPILIDRSERVVRCDDGDSAMIFVVQNERVAMNSPYYENDLPLHTDLHDINGPLLYSVFEYLSNVDLNMYFGELTHTRKMPLTEDCVFRTFGAVDRTFTNNHIFSAFHIAIARRSPFVIGLQMLITDYNRAMVGLGYTS